MSAKSLIVIVLPCLTLVALLTCVPRHVRSSGLNEKDIGSEGQKVFSEKCSSCHSVQSSGPLDPEELARTQGPTLAYAGSKFQTQWLEKWLVSPYRLRQAGYLSYRHLVTTATGDRIDDGTLLTHPALSSAQAKAVADYFSLLKKDPGPYPWDTTGTAIRAQVHFEKILGCGSCHQAQPGQGGLSGPELYTASERLNPKWTASFIAEPNYWTAVAMPKISVRGDQVTAISDYLFKRASQTVNTNQATGSHVAGKAAPPPASRAELLYQLFCSQCHGIQGDGKGINAPAMFVAPRNHTSSGEMGMLTDDRLYAVIKYGGTAVGKSALMPSWSAVIKDSDIKLLTEYLRALSNTGTGGEH